MLYMFIAFHIICDDFFVPSLNVLCEKCGLSDDIAGATFMAAGASSPELFASLIGDVSTNPTQPTKPTTHQPVAGSAGVLTGSAVGAGTVVGSELFNMLVIVGGVCLVSEKALTLDWRPLAREVFFFTLSLILVIIVLSDEEVHTYEAVRGPEHHLACSRAWGGGG
jgi:sodium/potassium/calcium exchanger 4